MPADPETVAFEMFANIYPHEAYASHPEEFWRYFQQRQPGVSREEMERLLAETEVGDGDKS